MKILTKRGRYYLDLGDFCIILSDGKPLLEVKTKITDEKKLKKEYLCFFSQTSFDEYEFKAPWVAFCGDFVYYLFKDESCYRENIFDAYGDWKFEQDDIVCTIPEKLEHYIENYK